MCAVLFTVLKQSNAFVQVQALAMLGDFHELSYIGGLLLVNIIF